MTTEQIIKALECCSSRKNCEENCSYFELKENFFECVLVSTSDAIDCIRRQKAEIDKLKDEICDIDTVNRILIKEKAEAVKEFEKRLYTECLKEDIPMPYGYILVNEFALDNLVKEMAGAGNET